MVSRQTVWSLMLGLSWVKGVRTDRQRDVASK